MVKIMYAFKIYACILLIKDLKALKTVSYMLQVQLTCQYYVRIEQIKTFKKNYCFKRGVFLYRNYTKNDIAFKLTPSSYLEIVFI